MTVEPAHFVDDRHPRALLHQQQHRVGHVFPTDSNPLGDATKYDGLEHVDPHTGHPPLTPLTSPISSSSRRRRLRRLRRLCRLIPPAHDWFGHMPPVPGVATDTRMRAVMRLPGAR